MITRRNRPTSLVLGLILCFVAILRYSCPAVASDEVVYHMKGVIKALPGAGRAQNEVLIRHEEVPDYRDSSKNVVGMHAMTMPFYLAPGVSVGGLAVGDEVTFTVVASWEPRFTEQVTVINKVK
jgi:hypothetical protein